MKWISTLPDAERNALIAERQKSSLFWKSVSWGSSLHLAMILLITLAIACAIATITESKFNADIARYYIYKSPWFLAWLGFLVINLTCVILSRWPWQTKHLSFIVAHIGIITMLTGAVIGQRWGFEGFMNLEIGQPPISRVVLNQTILDIRMPDNLTYYETPLPVSVRKPTPQHPRLFSLPQSNYQLKIDDYSDLVSTTENLALASSEESDLGPGIALKIFSPTLKEGVPIVVLQNDLKRQAHDFFSLATVEWGEPLKAKGNESLPTLRVSLTPQGNVAFQLLRSGIAYNQGILKQDIPIRLGWGDWQVVLSGAFPKSEIVTDVTQTKDDPEAGPGVRAMLVNGDEVIGEPLWIPSGGARIFRTANGDPIRIGFGLKTVPLPFKVSLLKFEVPRDEGTDTPADFIATVRFDGENGLTKTGEAHMNFPASFPGELWRSVIGQNFKFSQTSWNPQNLNQTTLQILFDPGWPLKWIGSILIVLGVALLFYYKPQRRPTAKQTEIVPDTSTS